MRRVGRTSVSHSDAHVYVLVSPAGYQCDRVLLAGTLRVGRDVQDVLEVPDFAGGLR